ncbi:hypothetical protein WDU94_007772 [Cyamophila willieti]
MALNHNLRLALSNCHTLLSRRVNVFESPFLFGCSEVMSIRQKKVWIRPPRVKYPIWFLQKERADYDENITRDNQSFVEEVVHDKYGPPVIKSGLITYDSPLKMEAIEPREMTKASRRTGLLGKIIGQYPLWWKNGQKVRTTLVQVGLRNHFGH